MSICVNNSPLPHKKKMSTLILIGFLAVGNGRREVTTKPGWEHKEVCVYHNHYTTSVQCSSGSDNTVTYVAAKCCFLPHNDALLDAIYLAPVPGDPNDESYEDHIPEISVPFVFGVGHVLGNVPTSEADIKNFAVNLTEYVCLR